MDVTFCVYWLMVLRSRLDAEFWLVAVLELTVDVVILRSRSDVRLWLVLLYAKN